VIVPEIAVELGRALDGVPVPAEFRYTSDNNDDWLDEAALRAMLGG
jgi:hypothetical protein